MIARIWQGWVRTDDAAASPPEDDHYLVDRETTVRHSEVHGAFDPGLSGE